MYCISMENISVNYLSISVSEKATPFDLALSVILRNQIELTKHFINSQQKIYEAYCTSIENMAANYKPVTLEDTKQVRCSSVLFDMLIRC
jgi:hypothetical protein